MQKPNKVLILGGTNFIGKTLLDSLSKLEDPYQVFCINRGKIYWNNEARLQHPEVIHFCCDRNDHQDTTKIIEYLHNKFGITPQHPWACVIDFSAYKWRDVQSVVKPLSGKTKRYIFISTDSIYNNSKPFKDLPLQESQFHIDQEYRTQRKQKRNDSYGYNKLKCEVYLKRTKYVPSLCLRLPDVIGPYDSTDRFWCCLNWIENHSKYQIPMNTQDNQKPLSFVSSKDIASLICRIIRMDHVPSEAYNICFSNSVTIAEFMNEIKQALGHLKVCYVSSKNEDSAHFYPSTQFGRISCQKAQKQLGWKSTDFSTVIRETVSFFKSNEKQYPAERKAMQRQFRRKVIQRD